MAWVRIHDGAMTHPKIVELSDKAFRLWVWGLAYSQQHLTDGRIPQAAVPSRLKRATDDLVQWRLWDDRGSDGAELVGGWQVHDYLEWNDSRARVREKQTHTKRRLEDWRDKQSALRSARSNAPETPQVKRVSNASDATLLKPNLTKPNQTKKEEERKPPPDASHHPVFRLGRLTVFDWMLTKLTDMLGPHAEDFRLDEWFITLNARCVRDGIVPPERDGGAWLCAETLAEAQRRGLSLKVGSAGEVDRPKAPSKRPYES